MHLFGQTFNSLTVIRETTKNKWFNRQWVCSCECGGNKIVTTTKLLRNFITHCGCKTIELKSKAQIKHGKTNTKEFSIWHSIISRCAITKSTKEKYKKYHNKNITVCDQWQNSFETFLKDMGKCPKDKTSLDRINNSKGYQPTNCRWATAKEQANNRDNTNHFIYQNKKVTIADLVKISGIAHNTLRYRLLKANWPVQKAIETPSQNIKNRRIKCTL